MIKDTFLVGISLKISLQHFEFYVFTNKRQKQNFFVGRNTSRVKSRLRCSMKPYWILTRQHQQLCFTVSSSVVNLESAPIWFSLVCAVFVVGVLRWKLAIPFHSRWSQTGSMTSKLTPAGSRRTPTHIRSRRVTVRTSQLSCSQV